MPSGQADSRLFKAARFCSSSAKASCARFATLGMVSHCSGSSSDRSWRSIFACVAFADSFLISAFNVSKSLMGPSIIRDCSELLDHLDAGLDVFVALFRELAEVVEAETVNVAQLLVDDDQPAADQHHAAEALMAHLQHRRDHHAGGALDRQRHRVEKQLHPPDGVRVGVADDRQRPARFLVQDIGLKQSEIALALPCAVAVLCPPDLDELLDERRVRGGGWFEHCCCVRHGHPYSSKSRLRSRSFNSALRSQGGGVPFSTSSNLTRRSAIS